MEILMNSKINATKIREFYGNDGVELLKTVMRENSMILKDLKENEAIQEITKLLKISFDKADFADLIYHAYIKEKFNEYLLEDHRIEISNLEKERDIYKEEVEKNKLQTTEFKNKLDKLKEMQLKNFSSKDRPRIKLSKS